MVVVYVNGTHCTPGYVSISIIVIAICDRKYVTSHLVTKCPNLARNRPRTKRVTTSASYTATWRHHYVTITLTESRHHNALFPATEGYLISPLNQAVWQVTMGWLTVFVRNHGDRNKSLWRYRAFVWDWIFIFIAVWRKALVLNFRSRFEMMACQVRVKCDSRCGPAYRANMLWWLSLCFEQPFYID